MKKTILSALCAIFMAGAAAAGDISQGAVPGSINYQGRLERDNAPITGIIHIYFRIYNASSGGTLRWTSSELVVQAAQGIFSANISPDWSTFANGETLYLEVQVEGEILTPRESLNSVAYAIVAKKLEDGASVSVATFTAAYQVLLATVPDSFVGIGTLNPSSKLTVNGPVKLLTGGIVFPDNTFQFSAGIGSAGGLSVSTDTVIVADSDNNGSGDIMLYTGVNKRLQIYNSNGRVGIGPAAVGAPQGLLDVDGSLYVGNAGIYDRDDGEVNVRENLGVDGGRITGANLEHIALGEVDNVIGFVSGGAERMRVNSNGFVGVNNAAPGFPLDVTGDMHTNTGLLASAVSAGAYSGWPSAANEVRAANLTHLLLQQNNPYNVGVGTDTPREKLHVHGSVRADSGVIAATAAFSGDVRVNGDFIANGNNKQVYLTTTTIYGTLLVTGGIGSTAGFPAYLASTQTLTGRNTFSAQVTASSDVVAQARLGAAVMDFDFPGSRYLQVGDNKNEYSSQDTYAYLVGGDSANSRLSFYRGAAESGSIGSINGVNVGLIVAGSTKTLTDAVYHRIQNSVVWVSTGFNTTPAIYVSSGVGNVGIGTTVSDSTYKFTVNGSMRIAGPTSNGIVFADGTTMNTAAVIGAATSISNAGDALIAANTLGGGGSVVLRSGSVDGLVVDSGGNIGVGTLNPVSKLNVRGGDLVLGNPFSGTYSSNGVEDLLVGGSVIFDGALIQRSASAAQFSGLIVSGDVYLSTGTAKKTGIATNAPVTTLDVAGNAQFGSGTAKSTFTAAGVLQLASALTVPNGGTGVTTLASNGLLYGNGAGNTLVTPAGAQYQVMRAGAGGTPAFGAVNLDQAVAVTGTLPAANGGTGLGGAGGTSNRLLRTANGTSWTAAQADLTTDVTGTLPLGNGGTGGTDAATARTSLGLAIGSDVQAYSARLATLAGLAVTDSNFIVGNGATWVVESAATARASMGVAIGSDVQGYSANLATFSGIAPSANIQTFLGSANYATARTNLGVAIGSDVQGYSANLATFSGIAPSANIQTFLGSANYATARTNLGVAIGSDVQAYSANLATFAGIAPSANMQTFLGSADNATARTNLGLGGGYTGTLTMRDKLGTGTCTMTISNGIITASTCI